jgi:phosphate transport system permease protein
MASAYETYSRGKSTVMFGLCVLFTAAIITVLGLVVGYLVSIGYQSVDLAFFYKDPVPFGGDGYPGGMRNGIVGTLILIGMASLVGIPVGMLTGVYLAEYSSNSIMATPVRFIADVLTGVPSIVVGILGYELLVAPLGRWGIRYNGWAGALALAFIMIPLVARTTEEMLLLVPRSYREASVALGATKARTILKVVLPAAAGSVITGIMLAVARVAGETAPLLFTALGSRLLETNPNNPFPSLTVQIYHDAMEPYKGQNRLAWAGILVLLLLIFVLNLIVRITAKAVARGKTAT